jgi:hypothetical protein
MNLKRKTTIVLTLKKETVMHLTDLRFGESDDDANVEEEPP